MVTGPDNKRNGDIYNMNGTFFLEDLLLSLKYEMIGFLIPIVSRSASLREENFLPVSPFLCKWFTILSSTPIWRKKVIISSVLKDDKFPSFGIVISFSGINLETAENKDMHVFITTGMLVYQTMNTDLNQNSSRCVGNFQYLMKGVKIFLYGKFEWIRAHILHYCVDIAIINNLSENFPIHHTLTFILKVHAKTSDAYEKKQRTKGVKTFYITRSRGSLGFGHRDQHIFLLFSINDKQQNEFTFNFYTYNSIQFMYHHPD